MKQLRMRQGSTSGNMVAQFEELSKTKSSQFVAFAENDSIVQRNVQEKQEQLKRQYIGGSTSSNRCKERICNPANSYLANIDSKGHIYTEGSQPGFDYNSIGILGGGDYAFSNAGIGFAVSYEDIDASVSQGWGRFDMDQLHGSLYLTAGQSRGCGFSVNGILGGGYEWYDFWRNVYSTTEALVAKGDTHGNEFDAFLGVEYTFTRAKPCSVFHFIPLASVQYIHLKIDEFKEKDAGREDLKIFSQKAESLRSCLGSRIDYTWRWEGFEFTPELLFGWQYEFLDKNTSLGFVPLSLTVPVGSVGVIGGGRNIFFGGIDLLFTYSNMLALEVSYDYEWNEQYQDHSIYAGINFRF